MSVFVFGLLALLYFFITGYQAVAVISLARYLRRKRAVADSPLPIGPFPGISVLMPVKGIYPTFRENFCSIYSQDYPGDVEIVLGVQSASDPVVECVKELVRAQPSRVTVKYAVGGPEAGLNPKNSNLVRAFAQASQPWLYCADSDVSLEQNFFRRAVAEVREDQYGSTFTTYHGASTLGAALEAVGTNTEGCAYFLFCNSISHRGLLNGASMFFHRSLLARVGGFEVAVNQITDDMFLSGLFHQAGAKFVLLPVNVREDIVAQKFRAYWNRLVRWIIIMKCNRSEIFFSAPTAWVWQWSLVAALCAPEPRFFGMLGLSFFTRLLFVTIFHTSLAGWREAWKAPVIVVYDLCSPLIWLQAVFTRRLDWAGNFLKLSYSGTLERDRA
jgi:cellulose synthase/poly-beta-1,6-N-acetylglucosamine synthase-like glycosyltransferase